MKSLMGIYNRELVDQKSQEFLMNLNSPMNRKKLAREMWKVDRRRIDLLPFFTRLAASLKECAPSVPDELAQYLLKDFKYHLRQGSNSPKTLQRVLGDFSCFSDAK